MMGVCAFAFLLTLTRAFISFLLNNIYKSKENNGLLLCCINIVINAVFCTLRAAKMKNFRLVSYFYVSR